MRNVWLAFLLLFLSVFSAASTVVVTPTVIRTDSETTGAVGSQKTIAIGTDGFVRALTMDSATTGPTVTVSLRFTRCLDKACATKTTNVVYQSAYPSGVNTGCLAFNTTDSYALVLTTDDTARIGIQGAPGTCPGTQQDEATGLIECFDTNCSTSSFTFIASDGYDNGDLGIATDPVGGTTYVLFDYFVPDPSHITDGNQGLKMASCPDTGCDNGTPVIAEFTADDCMEVSSLHINSDGAPRFAYINDVCLSDPTSQVHYWADATDTLIVSTGGEYVDMDLGSDNFGRVAWTDGSGNGFDYAQCTTVLCTFHNDTTFVLSTFNGSVSVAQGEDGFSRITASWVFGSNFPGQLYSVQCKNNDCSNSNALLVSVAPEAMVGQVGSLGMSVQNGLSVQNIFGEVAVGCAPSGCQGYDSTNAVLLQIPEKVPPPPKFVSRQIVDLIGMNPGITIPVRSKDGKIPFSFSLIENPIAFTNNSQWVIATQMAGVPSPSLVFYAPVYPSTKQLSPLPAYTQAINDNKAANPNAFTIGTTTTGSTSGWFFVDSSYVSHFFNGASGITAPVVTTDGSGLTLVGSSSTSVVCKVSPCPSIIDTSGNTITNSNNTDATYAGVVAKFADPANVSLLATFNGDASQTVVYTDTMGLTVLRAQETNAGSVPPNGALPTNIYSYTDQSGKTQAFTVFYQQFYQSTNFGCPGIAEMPRTPVFLPIKVTLPDNSFYAITYEQTPGGTGDVTGRIASVTIPTGGQTRYVYGGGNNGVNCQDGSVPSLKVTTPDGGTWVYTHTLN